MGLPTALSVALASDNAMESLRLAVGRVLEAGVTRERVVAQLEELRVDLRRVGRDDDEGVVLEVMDFASGWCSPHMRL